MTWLPRHPWNTDFTWRDHAGPFRRVTADQARQYDELGYFVIDGAVDSDTVAALTAAIEPLDEEVMEFLATRPEGRFSIAGVDTVSIALHPSVRSAVCREFCASELMADLGHDLIGPDVRLYWDQSVFKRPQGAEPVLWHQDNGYTYIDPQAYLTVWVALTDATPENGCISVLPEVHRSGTVAHRNTPIGFECCTDPAGAVPVPVRAGAAVVFSSLTPHATGCNVTDEIRRAYIVQYAPDGASCLRGDPDAGPPVSRDLQADPQRQFRLPLS
ncbi:MAG: phytanoyl-CoA dioxygenase family protein [Acidimicrobiia bacterium]